MEKGPWKFRLEMKILKLRDFHPNVIPKKKKLRHKKIIGRAQNLIKGERVWQ